MENMNAKAFLKRLKRLDMMISNKLIEREQWQSLAIGTSAPVGGDKVQSSSNPQKMESAIARYLDIDKEIDQAIDELVDAKKEVINVIEQIGDDTEYDVLHMIYVQYLTFDDVADKYGKSYSWAKTVNGRALRNVQDIINGKIKNC